MHEGGVPDPELTEQLRVAVIGYGLAGSVFHAPLVSATPGMEVSAIVTSNPERQARARRDVPLAVVLESADEVWRTADLFDLVVVATPNRYHAPLARAAMEAGVPVVIDKPMATSVQEARDLMATSRETGVPLTCFQNRRWDGDFLTVRRLMEGDLLGAIIRFESRFERYRPEARAAWREQTSFELGGGLLWDLGCHLIDQALVLFGRPNRVYAEMACRRPGSGADDDTFVALAFPGGVVAHLWMSVLARSAGPRFRVYGLRGTYEKHGVDPQESAMRGGAIPGGAGWGAEPETAWGRMVSDIGGMTVNGVVETVPGAYPAFYLAVRDALLHDRPLPVDPQGVTDVLRIIEAAHQSARGGQTLEIGPDTEESTAQPRG